MVGQCTADMRMSYQFQKKKQIALLSFCTKIADRLLYESKPIDKPIGCPPKKKSLDDYSEGPGRCATTPTPSNFGRTDKTRHWPVF